MPIVIGGTGYEDFFNEKPASVATDVVQQGWAMVQSHANEAYGATLGMIGTMQGEISALIAAVPALSAEFVAPKFERAELTIERPEKPELPKLDGELADVPLYSEVETFQDLDHYAEAVRAQNLFPRVAEVLAIWLDGDQTGLPVETEDALWNRDRERTVAAAQQTVIQETRRNASRGWNMPSGTLGRRVRMVEDEAARVIVGQSREVAIQQQQRMLETRRLAVQQAYQMSKELLELRLNTIANMLRLAIEAFDATTRRFVGQLQGMVTLYQATATVETEIARAYALYYQTDVAKFDADVRAAVAAVEAKVNVARTQVEALGKKIDAALGFYGASSHIGTALTSAIWQAVNLAAGIHGSGSESDSTSRSISFNHSFPHKQVG